MFFRFFLGLIGFFGVFLGCLFFPRFFQVFSSVFRVFCRFF